MRAFKLIAAATLILLAMVIAGFFWTVASPRSGRLEVVAADRIHKLCSAMPDCRVRIGDLFDGDWDQFYEFGADVGQGDVNRTLGTVQIRTRAYQRLLVLTDHGQVVKSRHVEVGRDAPLENEIEFEDEHHREQHLIHYDRNTMLRVTSYPRPSGGDFYVLSTIPPGLGR